MIHPLSHMVLKPIDHPALSPPRSDNDDRPHHAADTARHPTDAHDLSEAVRALYAEVDADIAARSPVCVNRGHCCKFAEFGHRLYVTDVERSYFVSAMRDNSRSPEDSGACPYQSEGRCTAREHRPLGCRVFFCDPVSADWQGPVYEKYLARLKELGSRFNIPYRYREWLSALADPI